jgi:transposase
MAFYAGIDLHSNTNQTGIMDEKRKRVLKRKLANDPGVILSELAPYREGMAAIGIESTYNWYWLADLLHENGYPVRLANPAAMQKYSGLKHVDDTHDAFWIAELLLLGILPQGYIYPKEIRPLRDLLRTRLHLVRSRTAMILSLQNVVTRNCRITPSASEIKLLGEDRVTPYLEGDEDLLLSGSARKESIDAITAQIHRIELAVKSKLKVMPPYTALMTLPGVGQILSSVIMLETGPIQRFEHVGCYASYCRKVTSKWTSNDKVKGHGNRKNGNRYLAWAFSEAAERARCSHAGCRDFYHRKLRKKKHAMVAHNALAHKLARAAYYILKDNVPFQEEKMFGTPEAVLHN